MLAACSEDAANCWPEGPGQRLSVTLWTHDVYVQPKADSKQQGRFLCVSPELRYNPRQDNYWATPGGQDTSKYFYMPYQSLFKIQEQGHQHFWTVLPLCPLKAYA